MINRKQIAHFQRTSESLWDPGLCNPFDIPDSSLLPLESMSSSDNAQRVCPAAAMADLRDLGVTFPGAALDCGSDECTACTQRRANNGTVSAVSGMEAQRQERLSQAIEEVEITEVRSVPGRGGEEDETSIMIAHHTVESALEALYEDTSARELTSINEILWAAADREQPHLLDAIDARCGQVGEGCEMVDINEPQIGLFEIDNA